MRIRLAPKTALSALAAVGLFLPFGAPLPGSCLRTIGVAGAAPSPSCGGDLRECLRASADMHQTTFGGRYVTADDVARCMEAFRACSSGGASSGGNVNSPKGTSPGGGTPTPTSSGRKDLPSRFEMATEETAYDCSRTGKSVECSLTSRKSYDGTDSWSAKFSGELSGLSMTGKVEGHQTGHAPLNPSCRYEQDFSGPARYVFDPSGSVSVGEGPFQIQATTGGSCPGSSNFSSDAYDGTGTWSEK